MSEHVAFSFALSTAAMTPITASTTSGNSTEAATNLPLRWDFAPAHSREPTK